MKTPSYIKTISTLVTLSVITSFGFTAFANAAASTTKTSSNGSAGVVDTQTQVQNIITKGSSEIIERLATLDTLGNKVQKMSSKVSTGDKTALITEIESSISGLTQLNTTLGKDTTVAKAQADYNSIFSSYRVYMLVAPKVNFIKFADDQQATEAALENFNSQLVTLSATPLPQSESTTLTDMRTKVNAASALSSNVEVKVLALQPSDYNADHQLFQTYYANLTTAQTDNVAAYNDGISVQKMLFSMN